MRAVATRRRTLLRDPDGGLHDQDTGCAVELGELLDGLRSDHRFRVRLRATGADCTGEVLLEVLRLALQGSGGPDGTTPAMSLPAILFGQTPPDRRRTAPH